MTIAWENIRVMSDGSTLSTSSDIAFVADSLTAIAQDPDEFIHQHQHKAQTRLL